MDARPPLTDPTESELLHAIAEHPHGLLDAMEAIPGAVFHREHGVTWYTTPVVSPMFSGAMRIDLPDDEVDAAIERVIGGWRDAGVPFAFWWTGPETRPANLCERLLAHGLVPWDIDAPGMAVRIDGMRASTNLPAGLRIVEVRSDDDLLDWKAAFVTGMEVPEFAGQAWVDATRQVGITAARWRLFVAYLGEQPVAVSGVIGTAGVASVFAVATVPASRGMGIGGAVTEAGLRRLHADGYRWGVLFSTDMGLPVYQRLGFRTLCRINRHLWRNSA